MAKYELRIETSELKRALDMLSTVTPKKTSMPIMADALVAYDRSQKRFALTATNSEQYLHIECAKFGEDDERQEWMFLDADSKEQPLVGFCINVEDFREAFGKLPSLPATCRLTLNDDGSGSIVVNYGKGEFTMPVNKSGQWDQFPPVPEVIEKGGELRDGTNPIVKFQMETQALLPIIAAARTCSANDDLRPVMNTVALDCFHDHLVVVASNGHIFYKRTIDTGAGWLHYGEFEATASALVLLPNQAASPLMKALGQSKTLTLTADNHRIRLEGEGVVLTTVCMEGRYPNYDSVIPKASPHRTVIDRQELAAALRRVAFFSAMGSNMAIMTRWDEDHMTIGASDVEFGRNADEKVAIINPDTSLPMDFKIGYKIDFMTQLLQCITTDNVVLEMTDPSRAILVKEDTQVAALTLLIMPMLVQ